MPIKVAMIVAHCDSWICRKRSAEHDATTHARYTHPPVFRGFSGCAWNGAVYRYSFALMNFLSFDDSSVN